MDWRSIPSLAALRAFSAFAECKSLTAAGAALGVSHAAISQQLRVLERHLGVSLVDRTGRALVLTPQGEILAAATIRGFDAIAVACSLLTETDAARPLHISVSPTLAASWLMPHLPSFRARHPEIDILIDPTPELRNPVLGGVDVALRYGTGPWEGLENNLWLSSPVVVVAAPKLLESSGIQGAENMHALPWLEELGHSEGSDWLRVHGVQGKVSGGTIQVPGNLLLQGALDAQGVALMVRAFVERDVAAGRLVVLSEQARAGAGYHIVTLPGVHRPALQMFLRWLRRQELK